MKIEKNLNTINENQFTSLFGSVFEKSKWIATETFKKKPFKNSRDLINKMIKIYENSDQFFEAKKNSRVVLMTTKAKDSFKSFKIKKDDTFLFGRESAGVPKNIHHKVDKRIKIPILKKKRSLNLSTSVSMVLSKLIL